MPRQDDVIYINGRFLTQPLSGMQRYAEEMVSGLDRLATASDGSLGGRRLVVLVPDVPHRTPGWASVRIESFGRLKGHAWEQIELAWRARGKTLLNLCAAGPLAHGRTVLVLHDAAIFAHPEHFSKAYRTLHRFLRPRLARKARRLVTISDFSRRELARYCGVPESAFQVLGDSAEHILHGGSDPAILDRYGLTPGRYALTVGNQTPNKNIALAIRAFLLASPPGWRLAVAGGGSDRIFAGTTTEEHASVSRLGRVSDAELRALYEKAGLFLFPSRYEGFGVPPLEAMALGCPVISSDASAMPEILGDAALYARCDSEEDMAAQITRLSMDDALRGQLVERGYARRKDFSWDRAATLMKDILLDI